MVGKGMGAVVTSEAGLGVAASEHSIIERLRPLVEHDPIVCNLLDSGFLWADSRNRVQLSGPDKVACMVARAVAMRPTAAAAIAVPRVPHALPALLGMYLALWRKRPTQGEMKMVGSVAVTTRRTELRPLVRGLVFEGDALDETVPAGRLVGLPTAGDRIRAAALHLRTRKRDYLDQRDSWLLFQLPNVAPPLAHNVISAAVVDTAGSSAGSWEQTWQRNCFARRRQLWVGELGDQDFERFCEDHHIPLVRFDWWLLEAAARAWGTGRSALASTQLAERAVALTPICALTVSCPEVESWLGMLHKALWEIQKRARSDDVPEAVVLARRAGALLTRISCPLWFYDEAARKRPFVDPIETLSERVAQAPRSAFRGRWKAAYDTYWPTVQGALEQLRKLLSDAEENPKWWALQARVEGAAEHGQRLRVLCQTRAEQAALHAALGSDVCALSQSDVDRHVELRAFSRAERYGELAPDSTLLCSPPPEWCADIYLGAASGAVDVLCFGFETGRLRSRTTRAWERFTDPESNHAALDRLALGERSRDLAYAYMPAGSELFREGEGFAEHRPFVAPDDSRVLPPDPEDEFWDRALELIGTDLPDAEHERSDANPGEPTRAVKVSFDSAPPMWLRADGEVTVVSVRSGEPDAEGVDASDLEPGMRVALLPGSERGSLLAELMAAWDDQLALARGRLLPMYRRALLEAMAEQGIFGIARHVGLSEAAVRTWLRGDARPLQEVHLKRLLELSGDEQAIKHGPVINEFFQRTRGAHRAIGRALNVAVGETVLYGQSGGDAMRRLRELIGSDIDDLLDNVLVLRVTAVSEPRDDVPAGALGSFLDADDEYLNGIRQKGAL